MCYVSPVERLTPCETTAEEILRSLKTARLEPGLRPNFWEPPRAEPESIGVSLSGGGYRAALFSLGALLAIVDGRVGERVRWVASMSGSSLANALIASGVGLTATQSEVADLVRQGIAAAGRSMSITKRGVSRFWVRNAQRDVLLRDMDGGSTEHVFVAVDLLTRQPAYFSRSFYFSEGLRDGDRAWGVPGKLKVKEIVRGSAGFPGLPPIRLRPRRFDRGHPNLWPEQGMALSDGGLWNNLATSWDADRRRIVNVLSEELFLPASLGSDVELHLVVDASTPVRRSRFPDAYSVPAWNILGGLVGQFGTLFESAVYAHRRLVPVDAAKVTFDENPELVDPVSCNYLGGSRRDWASASAFCETVRTVVPTVRGIRPVSSVLLVAYGYALTAAHLSRHGVDNGRFRTVERLADDLL